MSRWSMEYYIVIFVSITGPGHSPGLVIFARLDEDFTYVTSGQLRSSCVFTSQIPATGQAKT